MQVCGEHVVTWNHTTTPCTSRRACLSGSDSISPQGIMMVVASRVRHMSVKGDIQRRRSGRSIPGKRQARFATSSCSSGHGAAGGGLPWQQA